jgi:hypothetical protein
MSPRGKTPSLIGGTAGTSRFVTAAKKRTCKRCKSGIPAGSVCVEVTIPGSFGHKTYCASCYGNILTQTKKELAELENRFAQAL